MRPSYSIRRHAIRRAASALIAFAVAMLVLTACATTAGRVGAPDIPADAVAATKVMDNGDEVTEYRVAGQLHVVEVKPLRGPPYYLYDRNRDGRPDDDKVSPVYFKLFEW
jgi:predicted small secreted protein